MARVEVKGLRELGERMRRLSADMAGKVAASATGAAAQVIRKAAKQKVRTNPSVDKGDLERAVIAKKIPKGQSKLSSEHIVTVRGRGKRLDKKGRSNSAPHARFVEFGTVNMPAEPFLRPAFDTKKNEAVEAMKKKLEQRITKAGA